MSLALAFFAVAVATVLYKRGYGQGSWNGGPRLAAICVMAAATAVAAILSNWTVAVTGWLSTTAGALVSGVGQPELSTLLSTVIVNAPWVAGVLIIAVWTAAILPDRVVKPLGMSESMTWPLVWLGGIAPSLVILGPPGVQAIAGAVTTGAVSLVSGALGQLLQAGGA